MRTYFPLLFLLLLLFSACEQVINIDLDQGQVLLAVDGQLTDRSQPDTLTLTNTSPYFQNTPSPPVTGATVIISDDKGNAETLTEAQPGKYVVNLRGKTGNTYTLSIRLSNGEEYTAQSQLRRNAILTALNLHYTKPSAFQKEGYYVYAYALEPNGTGDSYRFKNYRNDTLANHPGDLSFQDDLLVDGGTDRIDVTIDGQAYKSLDSLAVNGTPYHKNDKVRFEIWSITDDQYQFYNEMQRQINNGGLFANPPANVRTNIFNKDAKGRKAVGYFGASSVVGRELVVK